MSNNPPKDAAQYLAELEALKNTVAGWSQAEVNEGNKADLRDLIGSVQDIAKAAEKDRKAIKEPHLATCKRIDDDFRPVADMAKNFVAPLKKMLSDFMVAEEKRKREEAEAARIKAEEEARKAEAMKADAFVGDFAQEQAAKAAQDAKKAERQAENNTVSGATAERAMGLRTYRSAKVVNAAMLVGHYANHPDVVALCEKLANSAIRAAKGEPVSIPGIEVVEEKRAA